jgi:methylphosphotriester-DNA--protein-cysteine methyltransferase
MPASFSEIASALSKSYRTSLREHPEFVELTGPPKHMVAQLVQRQEAANASVPAYAIVSSLGIIEDNLKRPYGDAVKVPTS